MLRASVTLSRKISRDFSSAGYAVTLDGEIPFPVDDTEAVLEKVGELFLLADEALAVEIERDRGSSLLEGEKPTTPTPTTQVPAKTNGRSTPLPINQPPYVSGQRPRNLAASPESATPKQQQYVSNLAKRKGLSADELSGVITQVAGATKKLADLTKREAGAVIDHLSALQPEASR